MGDSDSSTLSDESTLKEPVFYGGERALVGDGIGFPASIDYFAQRTLQADQEPAASIPVYLMRGQAGDLIKDVGRHLLLNYHNLKYELKVIAFNEGITGRFCVLFKIWSEKLQDGTRACLNNLHFIRQPLGEMTVEGIYLAKRGDIDEPSHDDEPDPDEGWFEDDGRLDNELLSFYQDEIRVVQLIPRLNNPERKQLGWVFGRTSTTLESLRSQIYFCVAQADLRVNYRIQYKDEVGADCFEPVGGNDEEWLAFVEMLSEIEIHATRIDRD